MHRIKVLPIYPRFPESYWSMSHSLELIGKRASMPPTGLATVMSILDKDRFEPLKIIDENVTDLTKDQIRRSDIVFVSSMPIQKESHQKVVDLVHECGKKVVSGGSYASAFKGDVPGDYAVLGEAELTLPVFSNDFLNGRAYKVYTSEMALKRMNGKITVNHDGRPLLSHTPIPRWDLIDINKYATMAIQYSRGCPFNCKFCDITAQFGRDSRVKSPEQMIAEFQAVYDLGWRNSVFVVDDNFIGNIPSLRTFLPQLVEWQRARNYPFQFFTEASINLGMAQNEDVRKMMVNAGFNCVFVGIESPSKESLKSLGKGQNLKDLEDNISRIQRSGLEVMGGFIVGTDKDTESIFSDMYKFIQNNGIRSAMVGLLTVTKGTQLYEDMKKSGRLRKECSGNNTHDLALNFDPIMDEQRLIDGYVNLLERVYSSESYYARCKVLAERQGAFVNAGRLSLNNVLGGLRILYENLFKEPDKYFRDYLAETIRNNPKKVPSVLSQAIVFRHLHKITEQMVDGYHKNALLHAEKV